MGDIAILLLQAVSMQRQRLRVVLFCGLVFTAGGCTRTAKEPALPPLEHLGVELRVACPKGPASLVREHARVWAAREGARVEVLPYDPQSGPEAVGPADVWVVPAFQLPRWASAGPPPDTTFSSVCGNQVPRRSRPSSRRPARERGPSPCARRLQAPPWRCSPYLLTQSRRRSPNAAA